VERWSLLESFRSLKKTEMKKGWQMRIEERLSLENCWLFEKTEYLTLLQNVKASDLTIATGKGTE
jgi:hypothetical protein